MQREKPEMIKGFSLLTDTREDFIASVDDNDRSHQLHHQPFSVYSI